MLVPARPRRSVLYMPGANARALEKSRSLDADGLIFDLEDAVAPDAKAAARNAVTTAVSAGGYGRRELLVRINGLGTPWGADDLAAVAPLAIDGVLLPKVESADAVREVEAMLVARGAGDGLAIWCMIETPRGVLRAAEIAAASPRLGGLVMGTSDLANDLRAQPAADRMPLLTSLCLFLLAARAFDLPILDGVHLDLADDAGFARACRQGRELGFDGKTLIHPKTIALANAAFAPSPEEIAWSRRVIAAHDAAVRDGKGIVLVDGKLIENLHVASARRLVALAAAIEERARSAESP
jgi:citrate lyase subunit beta / citryl-CoA lyase